NNLWYNNLLYVYRQSKIIFWQGEGTNYLISFFTLVSKYFQVNLDNIALSISNEKEILSYYLSNQLKIKMTVNLISGFYLAHENRN
ncbi:MAG TPA: hypothetical protein VIQ04_02860, partial [Nitrososphaeraceae archaeon]